MRLIKTRLLLPSRFIKAVTMPEHVVAAWCESLRTQQCADAASRMLQELLAGVPAPTDSPFDMMIGDRVFDVRMVHALRWKEGGRKTVEVQVSDAVAQKQRLWAQEQSKTPQTFVVVRDDASEEMTVLYRDGVGTSKLADMTAIAKVNRAGQVKSLVDELPWGGVKIPQPVPAPVPKPVPVQVPKPVAAGHIPAFGKMDQLNDLQSSADVSRWLKEELGLEKTPFWAKMNVGLAREQAKALVRVMDAMPEGDRALAARQLTFRLKPMTNYGETKGETVYLSEYDYTSRTPVSYAKEIKDAERFFPVVREGEEVQEVLTHELGHSVGYELVKPVGMYGDELPWQDYERRQFIEGSGIGGKMQKLQDEWFAKWGRDDFREISLYASRGPNEAFADAFSSLLHTPITQQVPAVKDLAERLRAIGWRLNPADFAEVKVPAEVVAGGGHIPAYTKMAELDTLKPAQVAKWLKDNLEIKHALFLGKMDPEAALAVGKQLVRMFDAMPADVREAAAKHLSIRVWPRIHDMGYGVDAYAVTDKYEIRFSGQWWGKGKWEKYKRSFGDSVLHRYHPAGTGTMPESSLTHELGHFVGHEMYSGTGSTWDEIAYKGFRGEAGTGLTRKMAKIQKEWFERWRDEANDISPFKVVSDYATRNPNETWAEAFASVFHQPESLMSAPVKDLRDRLRAAGYRILPGDFAEEAAVREAAGLPPLRTLKEFNPEVAQAVARREDAANYWHDLMSGEMGWVDDTEDWALKAMQDGRGDIVTVALNAKNLDEFMADGRYKTVYESKRTGAMAGATEGYIFARQAVERELFGYDAVPMAQRPVSGVFQGGAPGKLVSGESKQYGTINLVVREDVVRERGTFTQADSLDYDGGILDTATAREARARQLQRAVLNQGYEDGYVEAQIHGGLTLDDITEIRLPKGLEGKASQLRATLATKAPHVRVVVADETPDYWWLSSPQVPQEYKDSVRAYLKGRVDDLALAQAEATEQGITVGLTSRQMMERAKKELAEVERLIAETPKVAPVVSEARPAIEQMTAGLDLAPDPLPSFHDLASGPRGTTLLEELMANPARQVRMTQAELTQRVATVRQAAARAAYREQMLRERAVRAEVQAPVALQRRAATVEEWAASLGTEEKAAMDEFFKGVTEQAIFVRMSQMTGSEIAGSPVAASLLRAFERAVDTAVQVPVKLTDWYGLNQVQFGLLDSQPVKRKDTVTTTGLTILEDVTEYAALQELLDQSSPRQPVVILDIQANATKLEWNGHKVYLLKKGALLEVERLTLLPTEESRRTAKLVKLVSKW